MIDDVKNIKPMGNNVLIVEFYPEQESRLVVPGSVDAECWEVIASGPGILLPDGRRAAPMSRPGDIVAIGAPHPGVQVTGNTILAAGKQYRILSDEFILARLGTVGTMKRAIENSHIIIPEAPVIQ